jgi:hypothetical protein
MNYIGPIHDFRVRNGRLVYRYGVQFMNWTLDGYNTTDGL